MKIAKLCSLQIKLNTNVVCSSSFTGASNPGNDGSSVQIKLNTNVVCSSSFTGASNPGNDGLSVFSVAYSKRLVHKISD